MANNVYTQDVIIDADGKPVLDAAAVIERRMREIARVVEGIGVQTVADAKKWQMELATNLQMLKKAQSDLRAVRDPKNREVAAAYAENERQATESGRRVAQINKMWLSREEKERKASNARIRDDELSGAKQVQEINRRTAEQDKASDRQRIASARELRKARMEAADAAVRSRAGTVGIDEAREAKAASAARLQQLRAERLATASNNAAAARELAERIQLEKTLGRQLDAHILKLERQKMLADNRLAGFTGQADRRLVPVTVSDTATRLGSNQAALGFYQSELAAARNHLQLTLQNANASEQVRKSALLRVSIAERQVAFATRLVREEERLIAAGERRAAQQQREQLRQQAADNRPSAVSQILSPGYAGAAFARTSVYGAAAMAAYGAFDAARGGLQFTAQVEDELARLSAISGATEGQMQSLKASIFDVAAVSRYSTVELIKISQSLAQAGVSAGEMGDALKAVASLATASGSTPDEAVNLVTAALGSFQLQASEAARVADLMATALNRTRLTIAQAGAAIQYVGATAYEQNITLEQLLTTAAAMSQAGIKSGSTIGTGLRQFLVDLQAPSKKLQEQFDLLGLTTEELDVSVRGLPAVLQTLEQRGFGAAAAYAGLETRAAAAYLVLKNNIPLMDELQLQMLHQGAAAEANAKAMDSLMAEWQALKNLLGEMFSLEADEFFRQIRDGLGEVKELVTWWKTLNEEEDKKRIAEGSPMKRAVGFDLGSIWDWRNRTAENVNRSLGFDTTADELARDRLARASNEAARAEQLLATRIAETGEKIDTQTGMISELEKEYQRLLVQKDSLINNDVRASAEMASLMQRFSGLAGHLQFTTNLYTDLTNAVRSYIAASNEALAQDLSAQQSNYAQKSAELQGKRTTLWRDVRNDPNYKNLPPEVQEALNILTKKGPGSNEYMRASQVLADWAKLDKNVAKFPELAKKMNSLVQNLSEGSFVASQRRLLSTRYTNTKAASTPEGREAQEKVQQAEALLTQARHAEEKSKAALLKQADIALNQAQSAADRTAQPKEYQPFFTALRSDITSLRTQVGALRTGKPEKADKAAKGSADAVTFGNPLPGYSVNSEYSLARKNPLTGKVQPHLGLDIKAPKGTPVRAAYDGVVQFASDTKGGYGNQVKLGHGANTESRYSHLSGFAVKQGQMVKKGDVIGYVGSTGNSTGPHLHYEVLVNGKKVDPRKGPFPVDGTDAAMEAERALEDAKRYGLKVARANQQLDSSVLKSRLKEAATAGSVSAFNTAADAAEAARAKLEGSMRETAAAELDLEGLGPNDPEYQARMQLLEEQVAEMNNDFYGKLAESIVKNTQLAFDIADQALAEAMMGVNTSKALADARVEGFGYASMDGRVPDYVRSIAERRAAEASEAQMRTRASLLPTNIILKQEALDQANEKLAKIPTNAPAYEAEALAVSKLTAELQELRDEKAALDVALGVAETLPKSIKEGLDQAVESFRLANDLTRSLDDEIIMNLGGALTQVHSGFTQFFTDIFTGSKSVLGAFGDMVRGIINYLGQLAAQFVANKVFDMLLNLVGLGAGATGGFGMQSGVSLNMTAPSPIGMAYNGGKATDFGPHAIVQGYLGGGKITNGAATHDSVHAKLARDEWIVNRRAAQSVGDDFMADLNRRGAAAVADLASPTALMQNMQQAVNVWVVKPEEMPQMTKDDVVVTLQDELLNGESKKLVYSIAQGA